MFNFIKFAGIFKTFSNFAAYFYTHFLSWGKIINARKNVWAMNLQNLNFLTNGLRYHLDLFHAMSWYVWATFVFHKQYSISYRFVRKLVEKFVKFLLGIMVYQRKQDRGWKYSIFLLFGCTKLVINSQIYLLFTK